MIICGTGHRPKDLPCGYNEKHPFYIKVRDVLNTWLDTNKPDLVCSGMALGYDTWLAEAAIDTKILLVAYVPFPGQERQWPEYSQKRYRQLLEKANQVVYVNKDSVYHPAKMLKRNEAMVDFSDKVLALWSGKEHGGTFQCIKYARAVKKEIVNIWNLVTPQPASAASVTS